MATVVVKRPPRRSAPDLPTGEVILDPPPETPPATGRGWARLLMMLPMVAGTAAMGLMMGMQRGGPLAYVAGGMYGVSILGMIGMQIVGQSSGANKREMIETRRQYLRRLSQLRAQVRITIAQQRDALFYRHPDPDTLWSVVPTYRLWERRRTDPDFGVVRIGVGPQEIATPLVPPQTRPVDELEPLCAIALRRFVTTYSIVPDLPVAMAMQDFSRVYVRGAEDSVRGLVRAALSQVATFHGPDDTLICFCVSDETRPRWEWAKWLPHGLHPTRTDALGPLRLFAPTVAALEAMLDDVLANRRRFNPAASQPVGAQVTVVIDGGGTAGSDDLMTEGGVEGVTIINLSDPPPRLLDESGVVLDVADDGAVTATTMDGTVRMGRADSLSVDEATALARSLAPLRMSATVVGGEQRLASELELTDLLEISDPTSFDLAAMWGSRPNRDRLRVPIGVASDGRPIELDLKESAQEGMGPHGLLVGATGSGKSELLRTLVLALAATHHPEILNFVLVDFKGGATFATFDRLPHTSAVITNLDKELPLVDRMLGAISGELTRRQELLRTAGNYASQRDYERARAAGVPLAPLPSLLIICDEFSELLSARPDFIDMFVQIGRVGRSLGVHLLLASQRLEEGRLRGLEVHLSYRIGLRTFSSMESRAVLGVPDAADLPRSPGHGLLKTGTDGMTRFKAAYVSGVYRRWTDNRTTANTSGDEVVRAYGTHYVTPPTEREQQVQRPEQDENQQGEKLLDVLVARMAGQGVPAHQVWLPPLAEPPTLDQLLPPLVRDSQRGLVTAGSHLHGALQGVAGIVDKPFEQRRDLLAVDLSGAAGNVVVVGGPQSGKSTFLRTLLGSLALTHTPTEIQFYCLDFGGGGLVAMRDLPHMGSVASRREVDLVRRTIAEMRSLLLEREQFFTAEGIDSIATYRRLKKAGRYADDRWGEVLLVVDGWSTLRTEFEDLEPIAIDLAQRGLGFGIHLVATSSRWMDIRPALREAFGTKLELRLGEPSDSMISRKAALNVPERASGRGLTPEALHFLTGLPRIDGRQEAESLGEGVSKFVQAIANDWPGHRAPKVRLLPAQFPYDMLRATAKAAESAADAGRTDGKTERRIPIGLAEADLQPVYLDFDAEPHMMLFGDVQTGKSSFLRSLARGITERYEPSQARVILIDYRRSLLDIITRPYLIGYGTSAQVADGLIKDAVEVMRERLPGPDVTPEQLRKRNWWKGPELFVLVDDYDLVATGATTPITPLLEFLPQGRDIGLHLVTTRLVGGASRALYDPVLGRIRDLASPGLILSGPPQEGPLLGNVKPQLLPPGRGWLVSRRQGSRLVQLAWTPAVQ